MTMPAGEWFGDPADADVTGEFEPADAAQAGEPETFADAEVPDTIEADPADAIAQRTEVRGGDEDDERAE